MEILSAALIFTVGVVLVIKGGDVFVDAASWIAKAAGIPTFIIGATIVSFATTLPEMLVSCMASFQGKIDMAIGNAVGSVTANTAMIMAIGFIFLNVVIDRRDYMPQSLMLIACAGVLWLGSFGGSLALWAALVLAGIYILFAITNLHQGKAHAAMFREQEEEKPSKNEVMKHVGFFLLGTAMIAFGSHLLIKGGSSLAIVFGVPERIIAITFVAIGTSLPELVTTLTAIRRHESALSVGNIIGANVIDLALILPVCSVISGKLLPISDVILKIDLPVCFGVVMLAVVPLLVRQKATVLHGLSLLACYGAYLFITL